MRWMVARVSRRIPWYLITRDMLFFTGMCIWHMHSRGLCSPSTVDRRTAGCPQVDDEDDDGGVDDDDDDDDEVDVPDLARAQKPGVHVYVYIYIYTYMYICMSGLIRESILRMFLQ